MPRSKRLTHVMTEADVSGEILCLFLPFCLPRNK